MGRRSVFSGPSLLRRPSGPPGFPFPCSPLPACELRDSQGTARHRIKGKKEKRSLQVLQDRCDNPQSLGRVGGEREEPSCENGKLEWGLLKRTQAPPYFPTPHPILAVSHCPLNQVTFQSSKEDLIGLLLLPQKKSLSEQARCNFLSFVKAASCFPSFIAL